MKRLHGAVAWATAALSVSLVLASCGGDDGGTGAAPPTAAGGNTQGSASATPSGSAASPSAQPAPQATRSGQEGGPRAMPSITSSAERARARKTITDCMARHGIVVPTDGSGYKGDDVQKAQQALRECLKSFPAMWSATPQQ